MTRIILAATAALLATQAQAGEPVCLPAETMLKALAKNYKEAPIGWALSKRGNMVSIYTSDDSWTLVLTSPDGKSCIADNGKGPWNAIEKVKGKPA